MTLTSPSINDNTISHTGAYRKFTGTPVVKSSKICEDANSWTKEPGLILTVQLIKLTLEIGMH
jgi:hypothetical protein